MPREEKIKVRVIYKAVNISILIKEYKENMMSYIGFKYNPKIEATVKKIAADITFTQRPETMFAKL